MERDWIIPATAIVAAEYAAALLIGTQAGFHYSIPLAAYLIIALTIVAAALTLLLLLRLAVLLRRASRPMSGRGEAGWGRSWPALCWSACKWAC